MKTHLPPNPAKAALIASCVLVTTSLTFAGNGNGNSGNKSGNSSGGDSGSTGGGNSQLIPPSPTGWLTAFPTVVQTGTKPTLTWSITYPSSIANYVDTTPPASSGGGGSTVTTNAQLDVDIRVVGAGVTTGGCSGTNSKWVPTQALLSVSGGSYLSIFSGTNSQVNPGSLVWSKRVSKNTVFRFGGRYNTGGGWSTTYSSSSGSQNIRILKNGDFPPTAYALDASSGTVKSFMAPYLDAGGRIKIGPLDLIIMMELTQPASNAASPCYDLQDMVLLMTCKPKGNNGHGNNIDGVDSSNPGNSKSVDPSGTVDDERK